MTVEQWPEGLPQRVTYGLTVGLDQVANKQVTQFEAGPSRRRNRFSNTPVIQQISMFFKGNEIEAFNSFYRITLENGTKYFYFNIPVGNLYQQAIVRFESDNVSTIAPNFNRWTLDAEILIRSRVFYDPGAAYLIQIYGEPFVENVLADPLQEIVNVTYPAITENL